MNPDLDAEWTRCKPWIEAALEYDGGCFGIEDVRQRIDTGNAILWPGERSAIVTEICIYPRKRVLTLWLAGGDLKELVNRMEPAIEAFAREAGFDRLTIPGRHGWARVMSRHGYRAEWVICMKDLTA